jgi:hypothetical protein
MSKKKKKGSFLRGWEENVEDGFVDENLKLMIKVYV